MAMQLVPLDRDMAGRLAFGVPPDSLDPVEAMPILVQVGAAQATKLAINTEKSSAVPDRHAASTPNASPSRIDNSVPAPTKSSVFHRLSASISATGRCVWKLVPKSPRSRFQT